MPDFTILSANEKKRFVGSKGGEFIVWTVEFDGNDGRGTAEMVKQATSPKPEGPVDATLEQTQYGWKLKENRKNGFQGGSRQRDPVETKRIIHQHAQKVAIEYVKAKAILKQIEGFTAEDVFSLAKAFREDVERVD